MPVLLRYRPPTAELAMNEAHKPRVDGGESGAWDAGQEEFVQAHLRRIFLIVYRILGNVEDAQDVTQDVFIKALQRQDQEHVQRGDGLRGTDGCHRRSPVAG